MMKEIKNQSIRQEYKITREKFFDTEERKAIMKDCEFRATGDERKGRTTWPQRWMLVHLAMNTGLRVSEIAALKLRDIHLDLEQPYIKVRNGKRGKSRDVYIDKELVDHLRRWIWIDREPTEPLFIGSFGKHYTTTALHISFKKAMESAGLRSDLSIHSARHTYATLLLSRTGSLRYVQKQLGHASLNMTALYADILPEENGRLANMILDENLKLSSHGK